MTLYFVIFSDEVDEYVITESEPTSLQISTPPSSKYQSMKLLQIASSYFDAIILSKLRFPIQFMKIMSNLNM